MSEESAGRVDLFDLAPKTETVVARIDEGNELRLEIRCLSARAVLALLKRFPKLRQAALGQKMTADELAAVAPEAIAAVIASGCGYVGDEAAEAIAEHLPMPVQLEIVNAVGRLTFTQGLVPFVAHLRELAALLGADGPSKPNSHSSSEAPTNTPASGTSALVN